MFDDDGMITRFYFVYGASCLFFFFFIFLSFYMKVYDKGWRLLICLLDYSGDVWCVVIRPAPSLAKTHHSSSY